MHRSRSIRKRNQDLELRLGPSFSSKGGMLVTNCVRGFPDPITIEDDDDEVQVSSPRTFAEARGVFHHRSLWPPIITDEDLELRLGYREHGSDAGGPSRAINLCDDEEDDHLRTWKCVKKKLGQASSSHCVKEVKFTCSICMDTMKEETSTVCGHIFCKACITNAIHVQKKCPTCRRKLSSSNIHRIYLSGATT